MSGGSRVIDSTEPVGYQRRSTWDGNERRQKLAEDRLDLLEQQMAGMSVVMADAVAQGMRQALTDPAVLSAVWLAAMKQGSRGLHERAGRWLFSKWFAIAALVIMAASYIGWPATLKILLGLVKGDA